MSSTCDGSPVGRSVSGLLGWGVSLLLAYAAVGVLHWAGIAVSVLYTGSALATTAIGTLIPVLSDTGELSTPFGTYLLAAGACAEFGPILLLTLVLSTQSSLHNALILLAFVAAAAVAGAGTIASRGRTVRWLERTLEASSQLAVRWVLVLTFGLALLAYRLGLDLLLGGFATGVIVREMLRTRELPGFESKLSAIAFGVFVPFFFVVSGMSLDITAFASATGILRTILFLLLMLLVRGTPALILYRRDLNTRSRGALALLSSTQLPLVLAITALATAGGRMSPSIAADLVGAALLSTLIFPLLGLRMRRDRRGSRASQRPPPSRNRTPHSRRVDKRRVMTTPQTGSVGGVQLRHNPCSNADSRSPSVLADLTHVTNLVACLANN